MTIDIQTPHTKYKTLLLKVFFLDFDKIINKYEANAKGLLVVA